MEIEMIILIWLFALTIFVVITFLTDFLWLDRLTQDILKLKNGNN